MASASIPFSCRHFLSVLYREMKLLKYLKPRRLAAFQPRAFFCEGNFGSGSVTYSGGHASQGQGGFYGSGGSRATGASVPHHPEAIANQRDIQDLAKIVGDVEILETELRSLGNTVNSRTIEIKARIKKLISNPHVREILNRLEIKGQPVWGLSSKERDLVRSAREKYMAS